MQPTGADLVAAAETFLGQRYSCDPGRDDPATPWKDCSGLIAAAYLVATGKPLGANLSSTIFDLAVRNKLEITRAEADRIIGACYLVPEDPYLGAGPNGHIGFSDGRGGTVEATPNSVRRLPNRAQPWGPRACLLPGIDYTNGGYGTVVASPQPTELNMECLVKNIDPDANGQWWYFPPLCAPPRKVTPEFVLGRASFVPYGESNGPTIIAMAHEREEVRKAFAAECRG